jgi:hypothetical protein
MVNPLSEQCSARSKRSGERCKRLVIGGGVCYTHGGAARQVKARREQRVLLAEAQAATPAVVMAEPEEVLLAALHDTNATLQAIKAQLCELGTNTRAPNPALLELIGDWLDRVTRIGKVVMDGDLAEKLHRRLGWLAQDRAATVWGHLAAIVEASPLSAQQKSELWQARFDGLEMIGDGRAPFRLSGDALHRFGDGLLEAAALEKAAAEGLPWSDDSELDVDTDSDRVPFLFAVPDGSVDGHG